jgi:hypothetical protein
MFYKITMPAGRSIRTNTLMLATAGIKVYPGTNRTFLAQSTQSLSDFTATVQRVAVGSVVSALQTRRFVRIQNRFLTSGGKAVFDRLAIPTESPLGFDPSPTPFNRLMRSLGASRLVSLGYIGDVVTEKTGPTCPPFCEQDPDYLTCDCTDIWVDFPEN